MAVRTTRITIETEMLTIVRRAKAAMGWCPECRAEVDVITVDSESLAEPDTAAQIQQWLGTSKLHLWQTPNGPAQLCVQSLLRCFEWEEPQCFRSPNENAPDQPRRKE